MATVASMESILVVDCGSTTTRAVLVDMVDGRYRFVARGEAVSTLAAADAGVMDGARTAIRQIEAVTGRSFVGPDDKLIAPERMDGDGVDAFLVVSNAAPPLRLIVAGLSDRLSLLSARRAAAAAYAVVEEIVSPETEAGSSGASEQTLQAIQTLRPDAIVLTGGVDSGPSEAVRGLAEMLALGASLISEDPRPAIIYAGNSNLSDEIAGIFAPAGPVEVIANVRPGLNKENLEPLSSRLASYYLDRQLGTLPGFANLKSWSTAPVMTAGRAMSYVVKYLAQTLGPDHGVLGIDLGGSSVALASALKGRFDLTIRPDLGIGQNIGRVMEQASLPNIIRWLPREIDEDSARNRLLNKQLHPASMAQTPDDLYLEHAAARESLRLTMEQARMSWQDSGDLCPQFQVIVVMGGLLTHAPQHGLVALTLLDAIQPTGVTTLLLDETSLAIPAGAIAASNPTAAAQVMQGDAFINLGVAVCPIGSGRPGEIIMRMTITYCDGRSLDLEIPYGSLEVIPLPLGEQASLELRPLRGFDVGAGQGARRLIKGLVGGMMGIVVDARGRPLTVPTTGSTAERQDAVRRWYSDVGA